MEYLIKSEPVIKDKYTIGFLDDSIDGEFHNRILAGISEAARELDINIIRFSYYSSHIAYKFSHQVDMVLDHIEQYDLDGLIFLGWTRAGAMYNYDDFMRRFGNIPLISVGTTHENIPSIIFEGDGFFRKLLLHLIEEHHYKRIAYIEHHRPDSRTEVYMQLLKKYGIYDPKLYVSDNDLVGKDVAERSKRAIEILLDERKLDVDAIISLNIPEISFIMAELESRGIVVPKDMAVVSYEDNDFAKYSTPGVTTIYFPWKELGRMGCISMDRLLREGSIPMITTINDFGRIIYRESCGCMPWYTASAATGGIVAADKILDELTPGEFHEIICSLDNKYKANGIKSEPLLKAFISSCSSRSYDAFLAEMDRQLRGIKESHNIVTLPSDMRRLLYPYFLNDIDLLLWSGELFLRSQVLVNEARACIHGSDVLEARKMDQSLHLVSQALLFNFSIQNLIDTLEWGLPLLDIKNCLIFISNSIFTGSDVEEDLFDNSVLIFKYKNGKREKTSGTAGILRDQLSQILSQMQEKVSVAYLLHVTDEIMGFALFSLGYEDENLYQSLSTHISTALSGIVLLNRLNITYRKLIEHAQKEGMADIATNILHSIGNILNSIGVSVHLMEKAVKSGVTEDVVMAGKLLQDYMDRLDELINEGERGKKLLSFYQSLGRHAKKMQQQLQSNLDRINTKVKAINEAVTAQQSYAGVDMKLEEQYIEPILKDALKLNRDYYEKLKIEVIEEYKSSLKVNTNRAKLFYIIHNILLNAQEAMSDATVPNRRLTVTMYEDSSGKYLKISDTGVGIQKDLLNKIFDYGFTTKPGKYGYGLYSCTSYIADMGGSICAESDGEGKGASFILKFS